MARRPSLHGEDGPDSPHSPPQKCAEVPASSHATRDPDSGTREHAKVSVLPALTSRGLGILSSWLPHPQAATRHRSMSPAPQPRPRPEAEQSPRYGERSTDPRARLDLTGSLPDTQLRDTES